jgi:hypothetical protein
MLKNVFLFAFSKKYIYLCKKCKEVNNEEVNAFIANVFHTNYKSATNRAYLRSHGRGNGNYYNYYGYEPQIMMEFHVGGIYKCMMDDYLKDDNGQLVHIGKLDGFLFEEVKIDFHGCEKIIDGIKKHYGCFASVKPWSVTDEIGITCVCNVTLSSVNRKCIASGCALSTNPVIGLLTAYRNARKALAKSGKLNRAIHGERIIFYDNTYKLFE